MPVADSNSSAGDSASRASPRLGDDRRGERMLAALVQAGREPQDLVLGEVPPNAITSRNAGRPCVSVPVLSTISVSIGAQPLDRLGVAEQHARLRGPAGRDHDRHRRREPERAGAGDDQHRNGVDARA